MQMKADYIFVDPEMWTEMKKGSIILPDTHKMREDFSRGRVLAVGPGLWLHSGDQPPIDAKPGDHVLYVKAGAMDIVVNGKDAHIITERQVIAVFEPGEFGEVHDTEETSLDVNNPTTDQGEETDASN